MRLFIDTTQKDRLILGLIKNEKFFSRKEKPLEKLSENLLPAIVRFLRKYGITPSSLEGLSVNPGPGAFSTTRTGVATANALALAWGIKIFAYPGTKGVDQLSPKYDRLPNITKPKTG